MRRMYVLYVCIANITSYHHREWTERERERNLHQILLFYQLVFLLVSGFSMCVCLCAHSCACSEYDEWAVFGRHYKINLWFVSSFPLPLSLSQSIRFSELQPFCTITGFIGLSLWCTQHTLLVIFILIITDNPIPNLTPAILLLLLFD